MSHCKPNGQLVGNRSNSIRFEKPQGCDDDREIAIYILKWCRNSDESECKPNGHSLGITGIKYEEHSECRQFLLNIDTSILSHC